MKKTIEEIVVENRQQGMLTALKLLNEKELAIKLEKHFSYIDQVLSIQGKIPFKERPIETQEKLTAGNAFKSKADDIIFSNRKKAFSI